MAIAEQDAELGQVTFYLRQKRTLSAPDKVNRKALEFAFNRPSREDDSYMHGLRRIVRLLGVFDMTKYVLVMLGGALGAISRFAVGSFVSRFYTTVFPLGTFLINISGSFLIGLLMMLFLYRSTISANWRLFLVTGILGGYTTFSSFEWEALFAIRTGAGFIAIAYMAASVLLGLLAAWCGAILAARFWA